MNLMSIRCSLAFAFLASMTVQCVSAQGVILGDGAGAVVIQPEQHSPTSFATFKHARKYSNHLNGRAAPNHLNLGIDYPALNFDDEFATGLEGLEFRTAIRTDLYNYPAPILEEYLYSECLFEVTVRNKEDKLVLDPPIAGETPIDDEPGELVIIDYKVTLLDSQWAPADYYFLEDWIWEDGDLSPEIIRPLDEDWTYSDTSFPGEFGFLGADAIAAVGFLKRTDHPEWQNPIFCDFGRRFHNGLFEFDDPDNDPTNDHCIDDTPDNELVLPGASFHGTLVVEFIGACTVDPSITIGASASRTTTTNRATLHWERRRQFVDAAPFYKNSSYDNGLPNPTAAIATDKDPFFDGDTAQFKNLTSYDKGINGIVIDVRNQVCNGGDATLADFVFKTGLDDTPGDWPLATEPIVTTQLGGGIDGSDRIWLTWEDDVDEEDKIKNTWLQIQMPGVERGSEDDATFEEDATFYFGNLVGETGGGWGQNDDVVVVNIFDLLIFSSDYLESVLDNGDIESVSDFNRSGGIINIFDLLFFRIGYLNSIPRINPQSN